MENKSGIYPDLYKHPDVKSRVRIILNKRFYENGENFGHTDGTLIKISRVLFYVSTVYILFFTLAWFLGQLLNLNSNATSAETRLAKLNMIVAGLMIILLIGAFVLALLKKHLIASFISLVPAVVTLYLFSPLIANMESKEFQPQIEYSVQTANSMPIVIVICLALAVVCAFSQYRKPLSFFIPVIIAAAAIGFVIFKLMRGAQYEGGVFGTASYVVIGLLITLLILCSFLLFRKKKVPYKIIYPLIIVSFIVELFAMFKNPIAVYGFSNFYLRHALSSVILIISAVTVCVIVILDRIYVKREIDKIGEEIYKSAPGDTLLSADEWNQMVTDYLAALPKK